jgi:hypothetical protein
MNLPKRMWAWRYASSTKPSAPPLRLARGAWDDRRSEVFVSDVEYIRADIHKAEVARLREALLALADEYADPTLESEGPAYRAARAAIGDADA